MEKHHNGSYPDNSQSNLLAGDTNPPPYNEVDQHQQPPVRQPMPMMSPPHPQQTQSQLQVVQTVYVTPPNFGSDPMDVTCYNCQLTVRTVTKESPNLVCCLLFGLWSCCCPGCQDVEHYCPLCNGLLGKFKAA